MELGSPRPPNRDSGAVANYRAKGRRSAPRCSIAMRRTARGILNIPMLACSVDVKAGGAVSTEQPSERERDYDSRIGLIFYRVADRFLKRTGSFPRGSCRGIGNLRGAIDCLAV